MRHRLSFVLVAMILVGTYSELLPHAKTLTANAFGTWAVIGPKDRLSKMENIFWLLGNQSIPYVHLFSHEVVSYDQIEQYAGLITWTDLESPYNSTAVGQFAKDKPVISHVFDFCHFLYPDLSSSMRTLYTATVNYVEDWGNFHKGDRVEMNNGTNYLTAVAAADLASFLNVTIVSKVSEAFASLFHMSGDYENTGFWVMDLSATTSNSYEAGNWHLFPAIAHAAKIRLGKYCRWMTDGLSWRPLDWVYSWMTNFTNANSDLVTMKSIGTSVRGRPINALFIGHGSRYFIVDAAIHGNEKAGSHGIIRLAELLAEWYRTLPEWQKKLAQYRIILIPILNPDGYVFNTRQNANGKDLNRQFPPDGITTEPESWALRRLMEDCTPIQYVTFHTGMPMHVFYASSPTNPCGNYTRWAANEGNLMFQDLKHWGTISDQVWVGRYEYVGPLGLSGSLSGTYAFYMHNASSLTVEGIGQPGNNLHSQEFYVTTVLALMLHLDRTDAHLIYSTTFITSAAYNNATGLYLTVNATYVTSNKSSETRIHDPADPLKPEHVDIDSIRRGEGDGWSWSNSTKITMIRGANESILVSWHFFPRWDTNQDGKVNITDVAFVAKAYGTNFGSSNWDERADLNMDGKVNIVDVGLVSSHFKEQYG